MNADNVILDPRRILNRDESPQFLDYNTFKGNNIPKVGAVKGRSGISPGGLIPEDTSVFDDRIHEHEKFSTFALISNNACGVQTGKSLLARYKVLYRELSQRGVQFPVLEMTDNHESRYDEEVMEFCQRVGIMQWAEKSNTSGIFQALDQVNRQLHTEYNKGARELKHLRARQQEILFQRKVDISEIKISATDFISVMCKI
ncbi:hypothetical protein CYMTET_8102 [Cymbomonas tetramitiformis]|uniref:Uncharacterized protein n=1 Tax=Cymbomonas tetramitiformis TaxID=36881 RepID=A0AAE0KTU4_9CHLO|nr:hypothetical protein CYMTET_30734 [Cymbomonas tetramitiformis]KAK3284237.1 hypothetical protein CYMTET_8102 [Cymbomonas tetramitiformis]